LSLINCQYIQTAFAQLFATASVNGGITFSNLQASINITGTNFVNLVAGSVHVSTMTLKNVIGGSNDVIFYINNPSDGQNLQNSSFRSLSVTGGSVPVLYAHNAYIEQFTNCVISNINSPQYVIQLLAGSNFYSSTTQITGIDLSQSAVQNVINAVDSGVQLDTFTCAQITSF
jgi:hypothetical protein